MELEELAAIYLEELHVSGDTMLYMDHSLNTLDGEVGAMYLTDILAGFVASVTKKGGKNEARS